MRRRFSLSALEESFELSILTSSIEFWSGSFLGTFWKIGKAGLDLGINSSSLPKSWDPRMSEAGHATGLPLKP